MVAHNYKTAAHNSETTEHNVKSIPLEQKYLDNDIRHN